MTWMHAEDCCMHCLSLKLYGQEKTCHLNFHIMSAKSEFTVLLTKPTHTTNTDPHSTSSLFTPMCFIGTLPSSGSLQTNIENSLNSTTVYYSCSTHCIIVISRAEIWNIKSQKMWLQFCMFTYLLTPWSSPWEANRFAASQEIPCILRNPKVHDHIHKCLPGCPYPEPSHSSPYPHILKIHLNIILLSMPGSPQWSLYLTLDIYWIRNRTRCFYIQT
jgi:hypothetical protein